MKILQLKKYLILLSAVWFILQMGGCSSNQSSSGYKSTPKTPEDILRTTSYVGADACLTCHENIHGGWLATAHAQTLRDGSLESAYINDSDNSGHADFFDPAPPELKDFPVFSDYGDNAPVLGHDDGGAYMIIGKERVNDIEQDRKFYVSHTVGGYNGQWKQLYLTRIGNSHYILPVQFNAVSKEYVPHRPEDIENSEDDEIDETKQGWYDADNLPQEIGRSRSFERLCAGCHVTGLTLSVSDESEWSMDFTDLGVTCEACHGPGGRHVLLKSADTILNPATLIFKGKSLDDSIDVDGDGTVDANDALYDNDLTGDGSVDQIDHLLIRNMVCYACHFKGIGFLGDLDANRTAYPSMVGADGSPHLFIPSLDWQEYFLASADPDDFWGDAPSNIHNAEFGFQGFIAAKNHEQQGIDFASSPHAPDSTEDYECFVCHDMHSQEANPKEHMVATSVSVTNAEATPVIVSTTDRDNNTLCLACHAGRKGDFANLPVADVSNAGVVAPFVLAHMSRVAMAGNGVSYDPGGSGQGQCTACHMPKTAQSAVRDTDGIGDVSSHTFRIIWPSKNAKDVTTDTEDESAGDASLADLPNACNGCHRQSDNAETAGTDYVANWVQSGHGNENSNAWMQEDWDGNDAFQECQRCHTATGAKNYMDDPTGYDPVNNVIELPQGENQVLYCYGCHTNESGMLNAPGPVTGTYSGSVYTYPDALHSNICMVCHIGMERGETIKNSSGDFSVMELIHGHYLTAGSLLFTAGGYEFDGGNYANPAEFAHSQVGMSGDQGPCVGCHLSTAAPAESHLFRAVTLENNTVTAVTSTRCGDCHGDQPGQAAMNVARLNIEKSGLTALLQVLENRLSEAGFFHAPNWPFFYASVDNSYGNRITNWGDSTTAGKNNMGAAFNYLLILQDPGAYVHNSTYAKRLLFDAIDWLDNNQLDGVIDLTAEESAAAVLPYLDGTDSAAVARP